MTVTRVHRLLRIITLVQGATNLNARRLAEICGTVERTIYRDIKSLEAAGVPISLDEEAGGYVIRRDFFLRPVDLTLEEAMALLILAEHVGADEQIPHVAQAGKAVEKLLAILPREINEIVNEAMPRTTISLAKSSNEPTQDVYAMMRVSIVERRAVECGYESPRKLPDPAKAVDADSFRFDPYALYWGQRAWYVIGLHHGHNEVRTLKLCRFNKCKPIDKPYMIPDDFSLDRHFGQAWRMVPSGTMHDIHLHFDAEFAETVADTHWHDSQDVEWNEDGSIEMRFRVDGLAELVWFVMGYGPHCKVIEPPELRQQVAELFAKGAALY